MSDPSDSDATQSAEDMETEDEGAGVTGRRAQQQNRSVGCAVFVAAAGLLRGMGLITPHHLHTHIHRSRANSPSDSAPSDSGAAGGDENSLRLTARQRARMEKEAGIAQDVAWHEMELLPKLTYTWKGRGAAHGRASRRGVHNTHAP